MCTSSLGTITGHQNLELGPFFAFVIIIQWHWKKLNIMKTLLKIHFSCCHCCQSVTSDHMNFSAPGFPVLHHRLELAQTHAHQVDDAIQPLHSLSSPSPPAVNLVQHQGIWPKYWSFSFNISPSNEHSGLIFFRIDWLDLLVVQGTLKSLLQQHSSKASILQCSAFFIVQLSHPCDFPGGSDGKT